ncbi:MAG: putative glycoside hydrolase [Acidimicrobiales bacterium]
MAWFYKPPPGVDAAKLARDYDVFVLTKNDEHFRDQLKAADPSVSVLQYVLSTEIEDPGGGSPQSNQVAWNPGDFNGLLADHPDWFLRNPDGGRQTRWFGSQQVSYMDPASPGWQHWFAQRLLTYNNAHGWDGVFLDNVELSLTKRQREGLVPAAHPTDQAWQNAMVSFLGHIRSVLGAHGKTVWGNGIEWSGGQSVLDRYAGQLDGMMAESFGTDWHGRPRLGSAWEKEIGRAERLTAIGDHSLLVAQGSRNDTATFRYAYASYLLVAGPTVSFRYAHHSAYHQRWWYEAYDQALGRPTGARYRQGVGWRRGFEHGSVVVDPQQGTASISFG